MVLILRRRVMAYFLKKTTIKNKTYLSIYESFYNPIKKASSHKSFKSLGSVESLMSAGITDPIAHFSQEVQALNQQRNADKILQISTKAPIIYLGYFPFKSMLHKLNIKYYVDFFKLTTDFKFDLFDLLSSLIYCRLLHPCSKNKTFHEVLPYLYDSYDYSYDQLLDGLSFLGANYDKFLEIFRVQVTSIYGIDTSKTYFDCTNFYFEIDREDDFRKKGPSKENQKSPIVGLGLLLDTNQLPIGMKMYPGNESEKPIIRDIISTMKTQLNITGKTILVADKGLNCADNIAFARKNGDGYLFSKSVKALSKVEKVWVLLQEDWHEVKDAKGKTLYQYKSCIDKFPYTISYQGEKKKVTLTEKRLLTYNPTLAKKKRHEINRMVEKAHSLTHSQAKKGEYGEVGKYIKFLDETGVVTTVNINQEAIDKDLQFAGYNLLVTSEINMNDTDIYNTYHNLWRIEESFRIMKSDLDARPVFLQKEDSIKGHFLICYLAVLLERIFQFKVLDNKYPSTEIFEFIRSFKVTKSDNIYINTTTSSTLIKDLTNQFTLPLTNYFLTSTQIKSIFDYKV